MHFNTVRTHFRMKCWAFLSINLIDLLGTMSIPHICLWEMDDIYLGKSEISRIFSSVVFRAYVHVVVVLVVDVAKWQNKIITMEETMKWSGVFSSGSYFFFFFFVTTVSPKPRNIGVKFLNFPLKYSFFGCVCIL